MNTTFATIHSMVQLPPMDARITPPPEELNIAIPKLQTCPIIPPSPQSLPDTPHPDTPSICSPSSRRRRRRSSSSKSRPTRESVNQQPYTNFRLIFSPRPFESLYTDRVYLTSCLQQQAGRAADLMRQYCTVELQLQSLVGDNGRRKLRKQLALLKSKVNQAAEQEKAIFSRLGELYVEIQSRETWAQRWTLESSSVASSVCFSPVPYGFTTPLTPLSGTSEHFAPMGYFGDVHQVYDPPYIRQEPTSCGLETVEEAAEDLFGPESSCDSAESETTPATPTDVVAPFVQEKDYGSELGEELSDERFVALRERRLSLPCLRNAWPEV
ncbi:hypothetical protein FOQG_03923 [Fusarium oxysporum f. sp. raphani 54005]|uniref:Uncharacterized protein n=7 Tax=Fusarium oxysporum TaxID=5507 RepID=X0CVI7_FUSOX|nr:hypothetical protein FOXB_02000 [Fusarium oxysporum f. sp. conglutinans Fo5176]EXA38528.1 hypothetical protein FOVG_10438 [Fusarium oxysporum f. sp. pisi HDV247]EXK95318.1 hypothetical protein FOQG_03923 [Fusarium oxysporum f. sp. raphani 54005]EXL83378.1 hypothetical protein FOPG_03934 [Fusarium oxysporum f. sp. conglutinans race 2 54008]KAF6518896.1 hypothetical protein HZS61_017270 [Fusarium oxysporum f. sp. conglutinans]KAG7433235.1 hypothetical protein Forpi1262_v006658 [Fusarium oxysp